MTITFLSFLAVFVLLLLGVWFLSSKFSFDSLCTIFLCVWGYYALSVPLDLMFGINPRRPFFPMPSVADQQREPQVLLIFLHYLEMGAAFAFFYWAAKDHSLPSRWKALRCVPSLSWVVALNVIYFLSLLYLFGDLDRQERELLSVSNLQIKLLTLTSFIVQSLNIIYLHGAADKRRAAAVVVLSFFLTLGTGGRTAFVIYVLMYLARYSFRLHPTLRAALAVAGVLFACYWKIIWATFFIGDGNLTELPPFALSTFEGIGPYEISLRLFDEFGNSPYWGGYSYLVLPLELLVPRFATWEQTKTLAEHFGLIFQPDFVERGGGMGFSAVGEAWLNFSHLGPFLIGALWGLISARLDSKPRGLGYWIFFIMTIRLFRSDMGALFKHWVVLMGGFLCFVYGAMYLYRVYLSKEKEQHDVTSARALT